MIEEMPIDRVAEAACVGSCMLEGSRIPLVAAVLPPDAFADPACRLVWEALQALSEAGIPVDMIATRNRMQQTGTWAQVGEDHGRALDSLIRLAESVPSAANAEFYGRQVADAARARAVWGELQAGIDLLEIDGQWRDPAKVDAVLAAVERAGSYRASDLETLAEVLDPMLESGISTDAAPSGIDWIDSRHGGLVAGSYVVLAALTSGGKTSLALQIAAIVAGVRPVLIVSCEMTKRSVALRMLSQASAIPVQELRGRGLEYNRPRVEACVDKLRKLKLHIVGGGGLTPTAIRGAALRVKRRRGDLALVVVDYLQLLHGDGRYQGREAEVSDMSGRLKALAVEQNCCVLALAQFNREASQTGAMKRPRMHQLRESGRLEQDADSVWILHWERPPDFPDRMHAAALYVDKAREGPTGMVPLQWLPNVTTFSQVVSGQTLPIGVKERADG